ncbi:cellulase family glycosylhydrolase [Arcticibacterium luteifluviistationis]|uniref:Glycoside hydrolase n=1 Tax=Arcticibacterium luteifluviistationis TaxID=1784714 RepID=A0A2Z4GIG0_9BACT|nr:cellulase family glycosylhydrolase [Arcticibacterium luteifluviistationis]AWW00634.1 glycoside hydrolase [Arcticibacterium luteifluviistationis]
MKTVYSILFLVMASYNLAAQNIFSLNEKLGRGVNMGNMLEAPSEEEWGNPFRDDYFERIAELGFNHVRIPVNWDLEARAQQSAPYEINETFINRVKYVVDKAQESGLMAIINMHHHEDVFADPVAAKPEFLSQWTQISEAFKDYDGTLLFEVLNEPHGNLSPEMWNEYFADALAVIRKDNPTRAVVMGIANYGGLSAVPKIILPEGDDNIILSIHYYEPFQFTHQGAGWVENSSPWLGTKWGNTDLEQEAVKRQFKFADYFAKQNNVPINIGEFGAYSMADIDSRELWTTFLARWFEEQGYSWAYWEFSAGFGFFDPNTNQYNQRLVDALLKNPMPEATVTQTKVIYESDFATGSSAWNLQVSGTAEATFVLENDKAQVDVTKVDAEAWRVQFVLNNIALEKGKRYLVSFKAAANQDVSISSYIGQSSAPWSSYSAYNGFNIATEEGEYLYSFAMNANDDPEARFVFDIGGCVGTTLLQDLKVEEVIGEDEEETVLATEPVDINIKVYPNPSSSYIKIEIPEKLESYKLYNLKGAIIQSDEKLDTYTIKLKEGINPGVYFLKLHTKENSWTKRVVIF